MKPYIDITLRVTGNDEKEWDLSVHEDQTWKHILRVLKTKQMIEKMTDENNMQLKSMRTGAVFTPEKTSKEAGVFCGDIVVIETDKK